MQNYHKGVFSDYVPVVAETNGYGDVVKKSRIPSIGIKVVQFDSEATHPNGLPPLKLLYLKYNRNGNEEIMALYDYEVELLIEGLKSAHREMTQ